MTTGSVARRYARALYDLAREEGNVEETASALASIAAAVETAGDEVATGVLSTEARQAVGRAIAKPFGTDSTFGRFVQLVALRDRLSELPGIAEWFEKLDDEAAGRVRLRVTTAAPLGESATGEIVDVFAKIAAKKVLAESKVDESLIAGAVVELEGRVYDGSVKTKLSRLAARMSGDA